MRTFDSDLLEVLEATDGRSNSGALLLEAFHHGVLVLLCSFKYDGFWANRSAVNVSVTIARTAGNVSAGSASGRIREATARNLLTIDVSIDGKVDRFVVDTGATNTLIINQPLDCWWRRPESF